MDIVLFWENGTQRSNSMTDPDGDAEFRILPAVSYTLAALLNGYSEASINVDPQKDGIVDIVLNKVK